MSRKTRRIYIGTSGWNYKHWRSIFYPEKLSIKGWFDYYRKHFDTVEINNIFYNLPDATVFKNWKKQAPADFIYAVKANRYITHMKKSRKLPSAITTMCNFRSGIRYILSYTMKNPEGALKRFFSRVKYLKANLGPILYQLPPRWRCNPERLETFLRELPKDKIHVFEFRDDSWHTKEVFKILDSHNASFCVHDMPYVRCPEIATGKVAYLRFHGAAAIYQGGYPAGTLKKWAGWISKQAKTRDTYAYFNNDAEGRAVKDALKLKKLALQNILPVL